MKYACEMGSGTIIYTRSFIKNGSGIQKLIRGMQRHTEHGDLIRKCLIFQNKESRIKRDVRDNIATGDSIPHFQPTSLP
jgi:hypothetical protein